MKRLSLKTRNALLGELKNSFINSRPKVKLTKTISTVEKGETPISYSMSQLNDPHVFIERCINIINPAKGLVNLTLNEKQKWILNKIDDDAAVVLDVIEQRRLGTTTILCAYMLWYALTKHSRTIASVHKTNLQTYHARDMLRVMYEYLPPNFKVKTTRNNIQEMAFDNGSIIRFTNANPCAFRGYAISLAVLHDYEYYNSNAQEVLSTLMPTIAYTCGGKVVTLR